MQHAKPMVWKAAVSKRGQVNIPAKIREMLDNPKEVIFEYKDGTFLLYTED
jgi:bifunctional DNA-binding transcriptional regulator/antitoxin component of YhaV-PrlF toxin-antitoxin module